MSTSGRYKFTLKEDHSFFVDGLIGVIFANPYFRCFNGHCTLLAGYSWNGCTFAPDFNGTYYAAMEHDPLYQYRRLITGILPSFKRKKADLHFDKKMQEAKFKGRLIYFKGVRWFGWISYYFFN